jgi:hypothetical protein
MTTETEATGHMAEIIDFPPRPTLRPEQAVGSCQKTRWSQFLGIGITEAGEFEVVNSDMTAERALWLVKWTERWAMGLDEVEEADEEQATKEWVDDAMRRMQAIELPGPGRLRPRARILCWPSPIAISRPSLPAFPMAARCCRSASRVKPTSPPWAMRRAGRK